MASDLVFSGPNMTALKNKKRVFIRADGGEALGTGHIARTVALALGLKERGCEAAFIARALKGFPSTLPKRGNFPVHFLKGSPEEDAQETSEILKSQSQSPLLIVDHYHLDANWERALRPHVLKMVALDDLANRPHEVDILIDQNYYRNFSARYDLLVPSTCQKLLGPQFALLRPEFAPLHAQAKMRKAIHNISIFMGGSDRDGDSLKVMKALAQLSKKYQVDVAVTSVNSHLSEIQSLGEKLNFKVHLDSPHFGELLLNSDFSIGAGGSSNWERFCLGLPSYILATADNQIQCAKDLDAEGYLVYGGLSQEHSENTLAQDLSKLLSNPQDLIEMGKRAWALVDGLGVQRVVEACLAGLD